MKNYILFIVFLLMISCQNNKKTTDGKQSVTQQQTEESKATENKKEASIVTNCNNEKIAYDFLNGYIMQIKNQKSIEEIQKWLETESAVTPEFMKEYKEIFDKNEYVEADPILYSQDFPDTFIIKESNDEYISLTGAGWNDYKWIVRVKDCKVIGSGLINIPKSVYDNSIDNLTSEQQIQEIREVYAKVNKNLSTYKVTESEKDESTEGGTEKIYIHNNQIVKIVEEYLGEIGKRTIEYYFAEGGDLRFVFEQTTNYNAPIYVTKAEEGIEVFDPEKSTIEENRYYFYNEKMIRWLLPTGEIADFDQPKLNKKEKALLRVLQKYQ